MAEKEQEQQKRDWPPWWEWELDLRPHVMERMEVRIPLNAIAGSGNVISDSADRDHSVGAKRR